MGKEAEEGKEKGGLTIWMATWR